MHIGLANNSNQAAQIGLAETRIWQMPLQLPMAKKIMLAARATSWPTALQHMPRPRLCHRFGCGQIQFEMRVTYGWNETAAGQMLSVKILLGHTHTHTHTQKHADRECELENFKCENRLCFGIRICRMCVRRRGNPPRQ